MKKKTYSFLGHTTNHILYVGQVSIITSVLIPNQDMEHEKYFVSIVLVLRAPLFWTNPRFYFSQHKNNLSINSSKIAHTGLCQVPLKTGTLQNHHIRRHPVKKLTKLIKLYYTPLVRTWMCCYKLINMVPLIQHIQLQWVNM